MTLKSRHTVWGNITVILWYVCFVSYKNIYIYLFTEIIVSTFCKQWSKIK